MSEKIILTMLKQHRSDLDVTQDALAEMVDVTTRTIQRIESGQPTSLSTAKAISSVLQLPSYHVLTDAHKKQQQTPHEKISLWWQSFKRELFLAKNGLLFFFIAILALCAMIPVELDFLIYILFIFALLPAFTIIVTTMKDNTKDDIGRRVSWTSWLGIITCLIIAQGASYPFVALSFTQHPEMVESAKQFASFTYMPGVDVFTQAWYEQATLFWRIAGTTSLLALYGIYFFVRRAKQQGECFGSFSEVYLLASLVVMIIGNIFRHLAIFASIKADTLPSSIALPFVTWLSIYFVARLFFKGHEEKLYHLKLSLLTIWLIGASSLGFLNYAVEEKEQLTALEFDYDYRNSYCQASGHKFDICWGVALLEKYNLPITPQNTELLDALNGQLKALHSSLMFIEFPALHPVEGKPLPPSFYQFYSRGYAAALMHSKEPSLLNVKYQNRDLERLLHNHKEDIEWALKAKSDFQSFINTFEQAPKSVQSDTILSMFYKTFTGQWEKKLHKNNRVTYFASGIYITMEDEKVKPSFSVGISLEQLERFLAIPETEFPENGLR